MCQVSMEELSAAGNPRMFMLQKIVEISFYNMGRIRLQWSRIWAILGEHFNKAGSNANEMIAHFAVDALRQLSMKFLERGELRNFRFQKDFLRPFEIIMNKNRSLKCRELVVACMTHMVNSHWNKIISGWKNVFSVFTMAAGSTDEDIVESAFTTTNYIIGSGKNYGPKDSSDLLRSNRQSFDARYCLHYASDYCPYAFRSLTVMFEIMKTYGNEFKDEWWKDLFQVAFRIFDVMKLAEEQNEVIYYVSSRCFEELWNENFAFKKREWMRTTCNHALYAVVDVFTQYYPVLSNILLTNIYDQLYWCAQQENEQLARSAINCIENLLLLNGSRFTPKMWEETVTLIVNIFKSTLPHSLLTWEPNAIITSIPLQNGNTNSDSIENLSTNDQINNESAPPYITQITASNSDAIFSSLLVRCMVQLELVDAVNSIVFGRSASRNEDITALPSLSASSTMNLQTVSPQRNAILNGSSSVQNNTNNNNNESSYGINDYSDNADSTIDGLYSRMGEFYDFVERSVSKSWSFWSLRYVWFVDSVRFVFLFADVKQLLSLVDCLLDSHSLAKQFNGNNAQRTLLWKAGFKGITFMTSVHEKTLIDLIELEIFIPGRSKPNLLRQETHSLRSALCILFRIYTDVDRTDEQQKSDIRERLIRCVCVLSFAFFYFDSR
ncbi:unnamed protein product [Anisakis simplex]|uniref:Uncharacterized protein n=1 Tax=Anisakis simplex TaxID=6269 RepID=A0A3P6S288_ANISI|nr:unnamed protein product [Anisakis simplex]